MVANLEKIPEPRPIPEWKQMTFRQRATFIPIMVRAAAELIWARFQLARISARKLEKRNRLQAGARTNSMPPAQVAQTTAEVAYAIMRVAARLPWRSDCLVQALAGQRWLWRQRIPTQISIGATKDVGGKLLAHAWLKHGETVITGGEISRFMPLLGPDANSD